MTFGAGVLPHLDDLLDTLASKIIEVVIGIVSAVGQHPGRNSASLAFSSLTNRPTIDPELISTHMCTLIQPRCTCHFSLIHSPRSLTLIPVESTAKVQPEPQRSTIGSWTWLWHSRCQSVV